MLLASRFSLLAARCYLLLCSLLSTLYSARCSLLSNRLLAPCCSLARLPFRWRSLPPSPLTRPLKVEGDCSRMTAWLPTAAPPGGRIRQCSSPRPRRPTATLTCARQALRHCALSLSLSVDVSMCVSLRSLYLCLSVCVCVSVCLCLCLSVSLFVSLPLSLRVSMSSSLAVAISLSLSLHPHPSVLPALFSLLDACPCTLPHLSICDRTDAQPSTTTTR